MAEKEPENISMGITISKELRKLLDDLAAEEQRSVANMISVLLTEALTARGIN